MITSRVNPKIKYVRRLQRERRFRYREGAFAIEGSRMMSEVARLSVKPEFILYTQEWLAAADHVDILHAIGGPAFLAADELMVSISDTKTAPGVLAVLPMPRFSLPEAPSLVLVLDALADPGNLGTLIRSAAAAGVEALLLGPDCVDVYSPKVIRGGMGAHLRLPIGQVSWGETARLTEGMNVWVAAADGDLGYCEVNWRVPSALIVGSEARGASDEADRLAAGRISIPMFSGTESLNAAMAGSVILFEAARQRRLPR